MPDVVGFETSYRRHLEVEQRRAVLEAIAGEVGPDTTLGEILDAADSLGFGRGIGSLSLAQLAQALLVDHQVRPAAAPQPTGVRVAPPAEATSELDGERMSLDRASAVLVPIVRELGDTSMQQLESRTGIGRRKLRFHVGQLVKTGHLKRHGMGRGTYYTAV